MYNRLGLSRLAADVCRDKIFTLHHTRSSPGMPLAAVKAAPE